MSDQVYSTLAELLADLDLPGVRDEGRAVDYLRSASEWIEGRLGNFVPITETKRFDGNGKKGLFLDVPLLAVTTLVHDGTTLTTADWLAYPRDRHWTNGPYTRLEIDPDASNLSVWKRERDVLSIAGRWGKYEETKSLGITVQNTTKQAAADAVLVVSNGASVSPGELLLIGDEQELVTGVSGTGTDSTLNVSGAHTITDETVAVSASTGLSAGEILRIASEQMYLEALEVVGAANIARVRRGWNGTARAALVDAADVYVYRTFAVERGKNGTTAADHTNGVAISRYLPPAPVRYLARAIAAIMYKKAGTGFAAKIASLSAGGSEDVFYFDEFPKKTYDEILRNFRC